MKIGLIADTHIPSMGAEPPSQVVQAFEGVDLILHAGHVDIASCIKCRAYRSGYSNDFVVGGHG